jgi:hypothetical protein
MWVWKGFQNPKARRLKPIHAYMLECHITPRQGYERGIWYTAKPIAESPLYYGFHAWREERPGTIRVQFRHIVNLDTDSSVVVAHQMFIPKAKKSDRAK